MAMSKLKVPKFSKGLFRLGAGHSQTLHKMICLRGLLETLRLHHESAGRALGSHLV